MNIYRIWQDVNCDYDTYDSAIVVAENEEAARKIHPRGLNATGYNEYTHLYDLPWWKGTDTDRTWCQIDNVNVELVGTTNLYKEEKILLASFNAG